MMSSVTPAPLKENGHIYKPYSSGPLSSFQTSIMSNPELDPVTSKTINTDITALQKIDGFHKLIENVGAAMLVTRCESGALHSRAMSPCHRMSSSSFGSQVRL